MREKLRLASILVAFSMALSVAPVLADPPPPQNAKPLSEILRQIEAQPGFRYFDEVDWERGVYKVEYHMQDGTKREVRIDPVSGSPQQR